MTWQYNNCNLNYNCACTVNQLPYFVANMCHLYVTTLTIAIVIANSYIKALPAVASYILFSYIISYVLAIR